MPDMSAEPGPLRGVVGSVRHLLASPMARHTTLAAGFARFFAGPLMGRPFRVRGLATLAGNLALLLSVHRGESAILFCHTDLLYPSETPTAMEVASTARVRMAGAGLSRSRWTGCNGCATAAQDVTGNSQQ